MLKKLVFIILFLLLGLVIALFLYLKKDAAQKYPYPDPMPVIIPTFTPIDLTFKHTFKSANHLPIVGAAIIDIDNDNKPELWLGGGEGQADQVFSLSNSKLKNITTKLKLGSKDKAVQSYGAAVIDLDNDGDQDILVTRDDGIHQYMNVQGMFTHKKLNIDFDDKSTPIAITCGDINKDGILDMFVSCYLPKQKMEGQAIFKKNEYGANSQLYLGTPDGSYKNVTKAYGLDYTHNTFTAILIDVDEDGWLDLIVAHDTGETRTYKNENGVKFIQKHNPMSNNYGYPMGIAVGDYNNDGRPDFFFSNTGSTMPDIMLRGDLDAKDKFIGEWLLYQTEKNFVFQEKAKEANLDKYEFSWGAIFEDFNLDGFQDLVVAENYVDLPIFKLSKLPCRFLLNTPSFKYVSTETESNVVNENYAISPLSADFNDDGYPDLVYSNISGSPKLWLNNGGENNYLKINLPPNAENIGAKVSVITGTGKRLSDWLVIGEGLGSDQSHTLVFGLGSEKHIQNVVIKYIDGTIQTIDSLSINTTLNITNS